MLKPEKNPRNDVLADTFVRVAISAATAISRKRNKTFLKINLAKKIF
jgi:hypothetical protein